MTTIGPALNKWKQYGSIMLVLLMVIVIFLIATFYMNISNKTMLYIGMGAYAAIIITMMLRKMAEKVEIDAATRKVIISTYNVFQKDQMVIPFAELEIEMYVNKLSLKKKPGILFFQKNIFKFYLTLNQPGWTAEMVKEVYETLKTAKIKERVA